MSELLGWRDMPIGGVIVESGSSHQYETGGWRTFRPVRDEEKCNDCLRCWILCPESAVVVKDGKIVAYDLNHCKGCGLCAYECPPKIGAVEMELDR